MSLLLSCSLAGCGADEVDAPVGGAGEASESNDGGASTSGGVKAIVCTKPSYANGGAGGELSSAGGAPESSELASPEGAWTYTFFSPDLPEAQIGRVVLTQNGSVLSGDDGTGAIITGAVDGHNITLTSTWDEGSNTFVGLLSMDGQTMAGTWSGSYGSGTFIATKH